MSKSDPRLVRMIQEETVVQLAARARRYEQAGRQVPYRLQILLAVKQNHIPAPEIDLRDLTAHRLPQGTRLDSSSFREAGRHRAPNGRVLRDLRVSQGVHRPAPGGPPAAELPRGRKPADQDSRVEIERRIQARRASRERLKRRTIIKLDGVTPAALRKRRQRARRVSTQPVKPRK
jgi:hypothetical protein